jgi:hypothetical protein
MKKIRTTLYRFRLLSSLLVLVLMLSALAVTPARADTICEDLCWGWNVKNGCVDCHHCCVYDDGHYTCSGNTGNNDCGTGGPGLPD